MTSHGDSMALIDLHTHSIASPDGGLTLHQYEKAVTHKKLDMIAITDHGTTEFAKYAQEQKALARNIIVGQEIKALEGEIIGLFLSDTIDDGLTAQDTIQAIKQQGGFVLIPHPEDSFRHSMSIESMDSAVDGIDCVEVENGRKIRQTMPALQHWAKTHGCSGIAASDAHSYGGIGRTYTVVESVPTSTESLRSILKGHVRPVYEIPPIFSLFAPKRNRLKHQIKKGSWQ